MATQLERRNSTRQALLDAAAQCLQEQGVGGFTTVEVVRRSELSNGALFRYFPSRSELLAATVAHIFEKLRFDYERAYSSIPRSQASIQTMLELLWKVMNDPALGSIYEIYTTCRTDLWMRTAIEPVIEEHMARLTELGREMLESIEGVDPTYIDEAIQLSVMSIQGLAVHQMAMPSPQQADKLISSLAWIAEIALGNTGAGIRESAIDTSEATNQLAGIGARL